MKIRGLLAKVFNRMGKRTKQRLDYQLSAMSHAARGMQLIAAAAGRLDEGNDLQLRMHEAKLNFEEAARQLAFAMKTKG
jgi:hypothetical protein